MKKCPRCNQSALNSEQFCGHCGQKMDIKPYKKCPKCKETVAECEKFCTNCGQNLTGPRIINITDDVEVIENNPVPIEDKSSKREPWYKRIFQ